jgi:hypothetical protein
MSALRSLSASEGECIRAVYQTADAEGHGCDALYFSGSSVFELHAGAAKGRVGDLPEVPLRLSHWFIAVPIPKLFPLSVARFRLAERDGIANPGCSKSSYFQ